MLRSHVCRGSTAAKIVGENVMTGKQKDLFEQEVTMWVFEEEIKQKDGTMKKISEIINEEHENVKCHTLFFSCRTGFVQMHDETCVLVRLPIMFYHDVLIFW